MFKRRLGELEVRRCTLGRNCPQVLELLDGDFAVVGTDITAEAKQAMPHGPGVGKRESVVRIPRAILIAARADIPIA